MNNIIDVKIEDLIYYSVISWIDYSNSGRILFINEYKRLFNIFKIINNKNKADYLDYYHLRSNKIDKKYDIIFCFDLFEHNDYENLLKTISLLLSEKGIVYFGADNKEGIRFECGDMIKSDNLLYRDEMQNVFIKNNFHILEVYSVLPNLWAGQLIYSSNFIPNESLQVRYQPLYVNNTKIFEKENVLVDKLIKNNTFHKRVNSYLFVCSKCDILSNNNILSVSLTPNRGIKDFCITMIYEDKVTKQYPFSNNKNNLIENENYLINRGIPIIKSHFVGNSNHYSRIKSMNLVLYMRELLTTDLNKFLETFDRYVDFVYKSSDIVEESKYGSIVEKCFFDLVPLNCFWHNDNFLFFDQEFYIPNFPINLIVWRAIIILYYETDLDSIYSSFDLMKRYGIYDYRQEYCEMSYSILSKLRNDEALNEFYSKHRVTNEIINMNRKNEK